MSVKKKTITIGQLANAVGVNLETVRYYERIGLMPKPDRTEGGHRAYGHEHVLRLSFIRRARALGFSIEDVRGLVTISAISDRPCADAKAIVGTHLAKVRARLAALTNLESILAATASRCGDTSAQKCPVLELLDIPTPSDFS